MKRRWKKDKVKKRKETKIDKERLALLQEFEEKLGYTFKDKNLLDTALTHSSYSNETTEKNKKNNERLEFLGDSVLDLLVSEVLFKSHIDYPEGKLTKTRSRIVCTSSFARACEKFSMTDYLLFGKGEAKLGGKDKDSVKADTFEAVSAAIYLDAGYDFLYRFMLDEYGKTVENLLRENALFIDYKTRLQEYFNKNSKDKLTYKLLSEEGPEHDKTFKMGVFIKNRMLAEGMGKNKKQAEQAAAKVAFEKVSGK